jgi:drug/metabolite transporter (DMT)-like permease
MKLKNLAMLLFLAALWGPSFLFIKVAVAEVPPMTLVFGRVGLAAAVLYLILRGQGGRLPPWGPIWKHIAFVALVSNSLPFVLFSWGEQFVDSALASIMNGTVPLFTIILAHFFTDDDRLTPAKIVGVLIGLLGLSFLIGPTLLAGLQATTWGMLAMAVAAISYAVAMVYGRNHLRGLPPLVGPTMQMMVAAIYLLPLSLLLERPYMLPIPSLAAIGSWVALSLFGTAFAFVIYFRLLENMPPSYLATVTYIVPIFGVILGVLVLKEQLNWYTYVGFGLILLGVLVVNGVIRWRRGVKKRPLQPGFGD